MIWKNRKMCVNRVATLMLNVLVDEKPITLVEAVRQSLHKKEKDGTYRYCNDPTKASKIQNKRLEKDAIAALERAKKKDLIIQNAYRKANR